MTTATAVYAPSAILAAKEVALYSAPVIFSSSLDRMPDEAATGRGSIVPAGVVSGVNLHSLGIQESYSTLFAAALSSHDLGAIALTQLFGMTVF